LIIEEEGLTSGCYLNQFTTTTSNYLDVNEYFGANYAVNALNIGENANVTVSDYGLTISEFCSELNVSNLLDKDDLVISPNPGDGLFNLSETVSGRLTVTNIQGLIVVDHSLDHMDSIDLTEQNAGIYFYSIEIEGLYYTGKLVRN
jgi:hypothetical protein